MTKEEIIEMAKQTGMGYIEYIREDSMNNVQAFVKLVAEKEREACAKIVDEWTVAYPHPSKVIAELIRARGQE